MWCCADGFFLLLEILGYFHVVLCRWVFSSVRDAWLLSCGAVQMGICSVRDICRCYHMVLDLSPPRNTRSFWHVVLCRWVPTICQMMLVPLIICVMWYVLRIETRPRHVELHNHHHHQLIPADLIPGSNHKGVDLQQKTSYKVKVTIT